MKKKEKEALEGSIIKMLRQETKSLWDEKLRLDKLIRKKKVKLDALKPKEEDIRTFDELVESNIEVKGMFLRHIADQHARLEKLDKELAELDA